MIWWRGRWPDILSSFPVGNSECQSHVLSREWKNQTLVIHPSDLVFRPCPYCARTGKLAWAFPVCYAQSALSACSLGVCSLIPWPRHHLCAHLHTCHLLLWESEAAVTRLPCCPWAMRFYWSPCMGMCDEVLHQLKNIYSRRKIKSSACILNLQVGWEQSL